MHYSTWIVTQFEFITSAQLITQWMPIMMITQAQFVKQWLLVLTGKSFKLLTGKSLLLKSLLVHYATLASWLRNSWHDSIPPFITHFITPFTSYLVLPWLGPDLPWRGTSAKSLLVHYATLASWLRNSWHDSLLIQVLLLHSQVT